MECSSKRGIALLPSARRPYLDCRYALRLASRDFDAGK